MSNITAYSLQTELAQAAYGTFSGRAIEIEELTDNNTVGMPLSQATAFNKAPRRKQRGINCVLQSAGFSTSFRPKGRGIEPAEIKKWQVADQYTDPVTGVSATVFEAKNGGAKYLAIRGTELEAKDILADGILASAIPPVINPQFIALQLKGTSNNPDFW
ncbi:MAG: hypothetical protein HRU78_07100 [Gammaproteobacteria bacterium]|nr:MAG: hypothetical protein HRU78_07100 [Gammaproteobacteria bacterium]